MAACGATRHTPGGPPSLERNVHGTRRRPDPGPAAAATPSATGAGDASLLRSARLQSANSGSADPRPYPLADAQSFLQAVGVALYTTDAAGRITFFNDAAAALWGRRPELGEEWCGSLRLFWPDGRPMRHDECPMARTLHENRAVRGGTAQAERPDGTRVAFQAYPSPLRDAAGALIGAVNLLVDITDRLTAEEALRRAHWRSSGRTRSRTNSSASSRTSSGRPSRRSSATPSSFSSGSPG